MYSYQNDDEENEFVRINSFYTVLYIFMANVIIHDVFLLLELIYPLLVEIYERCTFKEKEREVIDLRKTNVQGV